MICIGSMDLSFGFVSRLREEKSRNKSLQKLSYLSLMTSNKNPLPKFLKFLNVSEKVCAVTWQFAILAMDLLDGLPPKFSQQPNVGRLELSI